VEIQYFGANCVRIITKHVTVVVDDNLAKLGLKTITKPTDISIVTNPEVPIHPAKFVADMPGEYEIAGLVIQGIGARAHMDEESKQQAVIYTISTSDVKVAVIGHIYPDLKEEQLEAIGMVDAAIIPVGGNGYTLDGVGALKVIKQIEPKVVIPTHYADNAIRYEVPAQTLEDALKGLGMEPTETTAKYKMSNLELTDSTKLIVLERQ
jgi:L-ascorbate metabolism protein UlaG (beta-lactamase superfamily)